MKTNISELIFWENPVNKIHLFQLRFWANPVKKMKKILSTEIPTKPRQQNQKYFYTGILHPQAKIARFFKNILQKDFWTLFQPSGIILAPVPQPHPLQLLKADALNNLSHLTSLLGGGSTILLLPHRGIGGSDKVLSCAVHTWYLSFFLHTHNFWKKFSPHKSA